MSLTARLRSFALASLLLALCAAAPASAHIHLTYPLSRTDDGLGDQKAQHCGAVARNESRVTQFKPGATIAVRWDETINHTGHFRISFNPDGDTFSIPPDATTTTQGTDPLVLHDLIADGTNCLEVTLPEAPCDNCTLQFIQLMYDKPPYTTDVDSDDIYFNCADIELTDAAPDVTPAQSSCSDEPAPMTPGTADGGCNAGGASGGLAMLGLASLWLRRRR
ncbi:MAG: lytic polysaccharide monooxygenase [Myxococcales bacterium]|nr:lytic polysaccharide monooxygenase [Myxococcales bacterium]